MEAEALRKFTKINLLDEVGPLISRLDCLLGHKHPQETIEADLSSALLRKIERDVVKSGVVDWTRLTIFVGQFAGQKPWGKLCQIISIYSFLKFYQNVLIERRFEVKTSSCTNCK